MTGGVARAVGRYGSAAPGYGGPVRTQCAETWTEDRTALLRKLWADGLSGSQIAQQLGGVTRNAVIGKVHRLGLGGRGAPSKPALRPIRVAAPRPPKPARSFVKANPVENKVLAAIANAEVKSAPPASVVRLERAFQQVEARPPVPFGSPGCKWPISGSGADMMVCGDVRDEARGEHCPYCPRHAEVAYQPPPKGARTGNELARSLRRYVA